MTAEFLGEIFRLQRRLDGYDRFQAAMVRKWPQDFLDTYGEKI